jgi:Transposase
MFAKLSLVAMGANNPDEVVLAVLHAAGIPALVNPVHPEIDKEDRKAKTMNKGGEWILLIQDQRAAGAGVRVRFHNEYSLETARETSLLVGGIDIGRGSWLFGWTGIGIPEQTFYWWKKQYVGLEVVQVRQLKQLQEENTRLKQLTDDLTLDKAMFHDVRSRIF